MGEDVEETQEFTVDASGGAIHTRQAGIGDSPPQGVGIPVAEYLNSSSGMSCWRMELLGAPYDTRDVALTVIWL